MQDYTLSTINSTLNNSNSQQLARYQYNDIINISSNQEQPQSRSIIIVSSKKSQLKTFVNSLYMHNYALRIPPSNLPEDEYNPNDIKIHYKKTMQAIVQTYNNLKVQADKVHQCYKLLINDSQTISQKLISLQKQKENLQQVIKIMYQPKKFIQTLYQQLQKQQKKYDQVIEQICERVAQKSIIQKQKARANFWLVQLESMKQMALFFMKDCWMELYRLLHGEKIFNDELKLDSFLREIQEQHFNRFDLQQSLGQQSVIKPQQQQSNQEVIKQDNVEDKKDKQSNEVQEKEKKMILGMEQEIFKSSKINIQVEQNKQVHQARGNIRQNEPVNSQLKKYPQLSFNRQQKVKRLPKKIKQTKSQNLQEKLE